MSDAAIVCLAHIFNSPKFSTIPILGIIGFLVCLFIFGFFFLLELGVFNSDFGKFGKLDGLIQWDLEQLLLPSKYSEYLLI